MSNSNDALWEQFVKIYEAEGEERDKYLSLSSDEV